MNPSRILAVVRFGVVSISVFLVGVLVYGWVKSLIINGISWRCISDIIMTLLISFPFMLIIYFNIVKKYNKVFEVACFIVSITIFFMTMIVFQRADLAKSLIDWKHAGILESFGIIVLLNLPLVASVVFAHYIYTGLLRYTKKLQQDGPPNDPPRG